MPVHLGHLMADMDRICELARAHGLAVVEDCAHAPGQQWRGQGAGCIGDFGSFSHQSSKVLTAGEGGTLLTDDEQLARRAHSLIDCGRAKDADGREHTFGANYRLGELQAALLLGALERYERQRAERAENAAAFERLVDRLAGVELLRRDPRITRWGFYRYVLRVRPEDFAGTTAETIAEALVCEGVPAEVQYPPMNRYELFQPSLSRLPVAVEHAERLDPGGMRFPVAEAAGEREALYLDECIFRAGRRGVEDAVEALAKVQRHADQLHALEVAADA
jgi:dTDP-4-amino-4,6-dideoxygalactose transaminase